MCKELISKKSICILEILYLLKHTHIYIYTPKICNYQVEYILVYIYIKMHSNVIYMQVVAWCLFQHWITIRHAVKFQFASSRLRKRPKQPEKRAGNQSDASNDWDTPKDTTSSLAALAVETKNTKNIVQPPW